MVLPRAGKRSKRLPMVRRGQGLRQTAGALRALRTLNPELRGDREKTPYPNTFLCEACGLRNAIDRHHIVRQGIRKSQGCDCRVNLMWLCRQCHDLLDHVGRVTFFTQEFPELAGRLLAALEHRDARNRRDSDMPCAPKWARRTVQKVNVCYDGP